MKPLMGYLFLANGIIFGIVSNSFAKISEGFTKLTPSILCILFMCITMFSIAKAMSALPVGFAYSTYSGLTVTGVVLFAALKFNQVTNIYATIGIILKEKEIHLSIETNGTIPVDPVIDWICVSPKDQMYPNSKISQRFGNELKVVYCGQDLSMYDELKLGFEHHYIQPVYMENDSIESNGKSFQIVEDLVKRSPGWRLSLQTHKWMGVL